MEKKIKEIHYKQGAIKRSFGIKTHGKFEPGTLISKMNERKSLKAKNK